MLSIQSFHGGLFRQFRSFLCTQSQWRTEYITVIPDASTSNKAFWVEYRSCSWKWTKGCRNRWPRLLEVEQSRGFFFIWGEGWRESGRRVIKGDWGERNGKPLVMGNWVAISTTKALGTWTSKRARVTMPHHYNCGCLCSPVHRNCSGATFLLVLRSPAVGSKRSQASLRYWFVPSFPFPLVMADLLRPRLH